MAFQLLVQMSDRLSPLWKTHLTNEVQLKLFLERYARARSPDVQGVDPLTQMTLLGGVRNCANRWKRNRPRGQDDVPAALPQQLGRNSSQTWSGKRTSPQASPSPVHT